MNLTTIKDTSQSFSTGRVDEQSGTIYGLSCITEGEAKGHGVKIDGTTLQNCLAAAQQHASGVLCKADHGTGVFDALGTLKNFRIDGTKLRADLSLFKSQPRTETILEVAKKAPGAMGLSIVCEAGRETVKDETFLRVKALHSIDLVDSPAANPSGMFSSSANDFEGLCRRLVSNGLSKSAAVQKATIEAPILFAEYRMRGGPIWEEPATTREDKT